MKPERIEPMSGEPAPNFSWCGPYGGVWSQRGTPHHGLCACTDCCALKRRHPITLVPFAVLNDAARVKGEPTAVLEYDGVRIEIGLTFLRSVAGALAMDRAQSFYGDSLGAMIQGLNEIERRMWLSYDTPAAPNEGGET